MSTFLLAGLGNIGTEYQGTRHNIGFDLVDALLLKNGIKPSLTKLAERAEFKWKGKTLICIKPTTYMNLSGQAVKYWLDKEGLSPERLLVLVDDIALPISRIRLRPGGSDAGHNGLRSIEEALGTDRYPRLRFGVGNVFPPGEQTNYVLGKWTVAEWSLVRLKVEKSVEIIESFVRAGLERTMNQYNKLEITL